jgi:photosystem II stability/assembly factor-like uncharacterized protein
MNFIFTPRPWMAAAILIFVISPLYGQPWIKQLKDLKEKEEPVSFFDIQQTFENYWSQRQVETGYYKKAGVVKKAPGWKQFKRWEHFWEYRVDPATGMFPSSTAYLELQNYQQQYAAALDSDPSSWRNLGVDTSYGGYAGIGRLNCIAFHPDNSQVIWVGAPSGGLWKTTDGGTSWAIQNEETAVLGVSDIIVPPDFSSSQTLYIATGDRDGGSLWTLGGGQYNDNNSIGVLKSTDGGQTWESSLSFDVSNRKLVTRLLMHPGNEQVLYAATSDGVYKTTDAGASWDLIASNRFIDMEFKPGDPAVMYGSTESYDYTRIYRSTDGGVNWNMVNSVSGLRTELAVTPSDPNRVYAVAANPDGALQGIYRSLDAGENFEAVYTDSDDPLDENSDHNLLGYYSDGTGDGGQGSYDLTIAAHPTRADTLFVGGINTWRSYDGGETWTCVSVWTGSSTYNKNNAATVHADKHAMVFQNRTPVLFEGNDGGIYRSIDMGETWTDLTNGMVISQLYRLGTSQTDPSAVIAGLQDNGTKVMDDNTWYDVIGGDGFECIIDYTNKNRQYGALYYGGIYRTNDLWNNRENIKPLDSVDGHWATPYVINPRDPAVLYAGYNYLWKTNDRGDTWKKISTVQSARKIRTLDVALPDTQVIFMGDPQTLWKTEDGGDTWIDVTDGLPVTSGYITGIQIAADTASRVWISLGSYNQYGVFETIDAGETWNNISSGLPNVPVMDVVQNRSNTRQIELYAATDIGVFRKVGSQDWQIFSSQLPNVVVTELDIYYDTSDPRNNLLRASTYGRGLWETNLPASTYVEPPADFLSNVDQESIDLSWQANNNGDSVLLVGALGSVDGTPRDSTTYQSGQTLADGGEVLYSGNNQSSYTHTGLTTLTNYHYKLWSFDGSLYSDPVEQSLMTICYAPGQQAAELKYPSIGTSHITLSWDRGTGEGILVTASQNSAIRDDPVSSVGYRASNQFGAGDLLGESVYVVYNGTGDSVRVEGLEKDNMYYFNLYEYNIADSCYLQPALKGVKSTLTSGLASFESAGFGLYPNPAGNTVHLSTPDDRDDFVFILYDFTGRKVFERHFSDIRRATIPLDELDTGIYAVQIRSSRGQWHGTLMKN